MSEVVQAIKMVIKTSEKTRYRIAQDSGVTQGQLSRLIHGKRGLTIETLEKLAKTLGYKVTLLPKDRRKGK